jgi:endonuclease YncB( thermonuclease family)
MSERSHPRPFWEGAFGRLPAFWALALLAGAAAAPGTGPADACAMPATAREVAVRFAIDGDTVRLADGRSLRLIGANALETGKRGAPDEPLAHEAGARLGELLRRGPPRAVPGAEPFDRHGRALADLYDADGRLVAATLAREGLALAVAVAPNLAAVDCVATAEREARSARRGLWADPAAWTVAARDAPAGLRGFKRVAGTVSEVRTKRGGTAVVLDGRLEVWLPMTPGDPLRNVRERAVSGARLAVRGWWSSYRGRPNLRVDHPAIVEFVD